MMYTPQETLTINGTDLATLFTAIEVVDGLFGVPPSRQSDDEVQGRTGVISSAPWIGPRVITIGGSLVGDTRASLITATQQLMRLVHNDGRPFTLGRQHTSSDGVVSVEGAARYEGGLDQVERLGILGHRVAFDLLLLDGYFHSAQAVSSGPITGTKSVLVDGDASTTRVTVTFSGGSTAQRLTNSTIGGWVEYTGSTSTAVTLDVAAFSALQGTTKRNGNVTFSQPDGTRPWFTLRPGVNTLVLTGGGSCTITWRGEYV